jgi:hypothetical protein
MLIGADRLAIGEEYGEHHVRVAVAGIKDAGSLMRHAGVICE